MGRDSGWSFEVKDDKLVITITTKEDYITSNVVIAVDKDFLSKALVLLEEQTTESEG